MQYVIRKIRPTEIIATRKFDPNGKTFTGRVIMSANSEGGPVGATMSVAYPVGYIAKDWACSAFQEIQIPPSIKLDHLINLH